MLTGSIAGAYHGVSRATLDVDIVVDPSVDQLRAFVDRLPQPRYYVDLEAALDAKRRESMFNVIDVTTGWKFDLIIRKSRPFSRAEFARRQRVDLLGTRVFVATAEDVVISKLEWAKLGQSQRQIEDVAGVLRARPDLDRDYLDEWVRELHLAGQWRAASELALG
jgi:hypothetical protein